jgi:pyrroloquinoline quinone biosynthesis protein D
MNRTVYRLARGVRLRRETGGEAMLLVPEGIVALNDTAAAALELADGSRDLAAIVAELAERFEAPQTELAQDVNDLFDSLASSGFVTR